jgi:hypothetical protein
VKVHDQDGSWSDLPRPRAVTSDGALSRSQSRFAGGRYALGSTGKSAFEVSCTLRAEFLLWQPQVARESVGRLAWLFLQGALMAWDYIAGKWKKQVSEFEHSSGATGGRSAR